MKAFLVQAALVAFAAGTPLTADAQTAEKWPSRSVRIIVPFPAGGSTDIAARLVGGHLSQALGQPFFVDNRSGANGVIGMDAAAKSTADGYTVLVTADAVASNPHVYKVEHDPLKDLAPVIQLSRQPLVLAAHPSLGANTLPELIALAKQQPGLRYATGSGYGSSQHMVGQWFAKLAGLEMEQVGYRGGGQAINDLIAGHVKLGCLGSTPLIPHYQAGNLRLLAQSTAMRSSSLPNVPTFQEAGFAELVLDQWLGVLVPTGTNAAIIGRLNAEIDKALVDPAIRAKLLEAAQDPVGGTAEAFGHRMREDFDKYGRLVKEQDIKIK
jgi:tripartite-type tricarboxylate transporter receptor subunit TctC